MKKGIEVWADYDAEGRWCLRIKKKKGKFSVDEITEIATEYEEDFYAVIIKAISDEMGQYFDDIEQGDYITLYQATDFLRNEVCTWEDTEELRKRGINYKNDGLFKPRCNNNEDDFRDWNCIRHFKYCPYCGKKIVIKE